jgi:excisionase family DNA binding protein
MINELDRLLTITDLSEMLGVPVDTLYGWRHRGEGPAGYRIGRHVRYAEQPSRLGLTPKPTSARGEVAHIERRRLRQPDGSG